MPLKTVLGEWLAWEGGSGWPIEYLKIDAQGFDLGVFESAGTALMPRIRHVEMEMVKDTCAPMYEGALRCTEMVARMAAHGYRPNKSCETAKFAGAKGCEEEGFVFTRVRDGV